MNSNDWVAAHIESRVKRGKEWRTQLDRHKEIANNSRYIRILGSGFRAVSIDTVNPCGHLRDGDEREIPARLELEHALQDAMLASNVSLPPGANKPEHRLQASLIRAAMQNDLRFGDILPGLQDGFDDLIFVTDEFAIKPGNGEIECRADIVAIGRSKRAKTYSPVFIELKNTRSLGRLKEQLKNAATSLCEKEDVQQPFKAFLSAVSGVEPDEIECSSGTARRLIIWPKSQSGQESKSVEEARKDGFIIVEFQRN
jgi:hypothetical protein